MSKTVRFCGLIAVACSAIWAKGHQKLSADLSSLDPRANVKVIIQWKTVPEDSEHRKVTDRRGVLRSHLKSIKAAAYTVPASALDSLADDPGVFYISADRPLSGKLDNSATAVNAKAVWKAGWIGTGIGVALIDSGIAPGNDLGGGGPGTRIVYSQNFVEDKGNGFDRYGHGTHVAGIIAANGAGL